MPYTRYSVFNPGGEMPELSDVEHANIDEMHRMRDYQLKAALMAQNGDALRAELADRAAGRTFQSGENRANRDFQSGLVDKQFAGQGTLLDKQLAGNRDITKLTLEGNLADTRARNEPALGYLGLEKDRWAAGAPQREYDTNRLHSKGRVEDLLDTTTFNALSEKFGGGAPGAAGAPAAAPMREGTPGAFALVGAGGGMARPSGGAGAGAGGLTADDIIRARLGMGKDPDKEFGRTVDQGLVQTWLEGLKSPRKEVREGARANLVAHGIDIGDANAYAAPSMVTPEQLEGPLGEGLKRFVDRDASWFDANPTEQDAGDIKAMYGKLVEAYSQQNGGDVELAKQQAKATVRRLSAQSGQGADYETDWFAGKTRKLLGELQ